MFKPKFEVLPTTEIRKHFPALERVHNGYPVAYFDGPGAGWTAWWGQRQADLGIDPANPDAEPGLTPPPMTPQRARHFDRIVDQQQDQVDVHHVP